jgi:hypothetical protein
MERESLLQSNGELLEWEAVGNALAKKDRKQPMPHAQC